MSRFKNSMQQFDSAIKETIHNFIRERFLSVSAVDSIHPDESLIMNGVIDSTGVLEFIEFLEGAFQIEIMDEELIPENLDSVNKAVAFIERKTCPGIRG